MVNYFLIARYSSVEIGEDSLKLLLVLTEEVLTSELIYLLISG